MQPRSSTITPRRYLLTLHKSQASRQQVRSIVTSNPSWDARPVSTKDYRNFKSIMGCTPSEYQRKTGASITASTLPK